MDKILLGHGSGGKLMHRLIAETIAPAFGISELGDSAVLDGAELAGGRIAFTTDSYVVSPIFFPGGDIGDLAVNGTVNDLSMVGGIPLWLTAGLIVEEGFPAESLARVLASMKAAAQKAGVRIVAGDTKVVDRGKGDGIFINTAGVGVIPQEILLGARQVRAGDRILISGQIGNHGVAVMAERNGLTFEPPLMSDCAPLNGIVAELLAAVPGSVRIMRDPTRGGLATTLKEIALETGFCFSLAEDSIPVPDAVRGACDLLGLDPLYVANEGIFIALIAEAAAEQALGVLRGHPLGRHAAIIGEVKAPDERSRGMVLLRTVIGGTRIVDMLAGEQLPRIC
ncbi:MAG: hydrogenase expression/formation protein HypE [Nitrospiraceae bacterium]|jgi:hydrogenase expression/formation protein HypE|nr:hydrogenase expression/formation protein HypE [Nitrospiraceae bacterium]